MAIGSSKQDRAVCLSAATGHSEMLPEYGPGMSWVCLRWFVILPMIILQSIFGNVRGIRLISIYPSSNSKLMVGGGSMHPHVFVVHTAKPAVPAREVFFYRQPNSILPGLHSLHSSWFVTKRIDAHTRPNAFCCFYPKQFV